MDITVGSIIQQCRTIATLRLIMNSEASKNNQESTRDSDHRPLLSTQLAGRAQHTGSSITQVNHLMCLLLFLVKMSTFLNMQARRVGWFPSKSVSTIFRLPRPFKYIMRHQSDMILSVIVGAQSEQPTESLTLQFHTIALGSALRRVGWRDWFHISGDHRGFLLGRNRINARTRGTVSLLPFVR